MTPDEKRQRAHRAQRLLDDEMMQEAFEALDAAYVNAWRQGKTVEAREDAHRYLTLLKKFQAHFKSVLMDSNLAAKDAKEIQGKKRLW